MVKIVSSILRSNIYRPSRFHRPHFNALIRLKSTSKKDEIATRKEHQKFINYTFGPPLFYEPDDVKVSNTKPKNKVNLMQGIRKRLGRYAKSHGVIGPNVIQTSEQKYEGIEEVTKERNHQDKQDIVISHSRESSKRAPKGKQNQDFQQSKSKNEFDKCAAPDKTEAQIFDDLASKYLKEELDQIDKQLARDMEQLEFPDFKVKREAVVSSTLLNVSNDADNTQISNYSHYFEPSIKYLENVASKKTKVFKVYNDHNEFHHDTIPLHLINCLNQFDSTPNTPIAKLELDETLPLHIMMPIALSKEANVYELYGPCACSMHNHEIISFHLINCLNQFDSTPKTSDNDSIIPKLELDETLPLHILITESEKTQNTQVQTSPKSDEQQTTNEPKDLPQVAFVQAKANPAKNTESSMRLKESTHVIPKYEKYELTTLKPDLSGKNYQEEVPELPDTGQIMKKETRAAQNIQAQTSPKSYEEQPKTLPRAVGMESNANAVKVFRVVQTTKIDQNQQNVKATTKDDDIMNNLDLDPKLPLEEILRRIRARNRLQNIKKVRPINMSSLVPAKKDPPNDRPECPRPLESSKVCFPPTELKGSPKKPECPPTQPEYTPSSSSAKRCPPSDRPQCPSPPKSYKVCPPRTELKCPPTRPKCPPSNSSDGRPQCPPPPSKTLKFAALKCPPEKLECPSPCCPCPPPPPPPNCPPLPCHPPPPCLPQPCFPVPPPCCPSPCCPPPCCPPPCSPPSCCPPSGCPPPCCTPPSCPHPPCPPRCSCNIVPPTCWHQFIISQAVYLMDDCPTPCGPPSRCKSKAPRCPPDASKCPPKPPKGPPKVDWCEKPKKCPPDPPKCPPNPCPPKPTCPPKPKCPPPPKRKCAPEPKCPRMPKCPPEPKCAPKPVCPPKPKYITGCSLHDSIVLVSSLDLALSTPTPLACNLSNSLKEILENGLLRLKSASFMVFTESILEMRTLYLNRVKDFVPWTPIPSWPHPIQEEKQKLQCPRDGCPSQRPGRFRHPCPEKPCPGFPKRLSFSDI